MAGPFGPPPLTADYLVIAGGGAGGRGGTGEPAGGGGAGGYRTSAGTSGGGASAETSLSLVSGVAYTVTDEHWRTIANPAAQIGDRNSWTQKHRDDEAPQASG